MLHFTLGGIHVFPWEHFLSDFKNKTTIHKKFSVRGT